MFGRVDTGQYRHEVECRTVDEIEQDVQITVGGVEAQQIRPAQRVDTAEKRPCQQNGNQRGHTARHVANDVLAHLLGGQLGLGDGGIRCRGLGILHRFAGGEVGQRTQLFIDLGYVCADDDLVLLAAAHHAQHTADGFDFLILGYGVVLQVKPQPGHAVGGVFQVGSTTHSRQNMLGDLFVVCHFVFLLFMIPTGRFAGRPVDTR